MPRTVNLGRDDRAHTRAANRVFSKGHLSVFVDSMPATLNLLLNQHNSKEGKLAMFESPINYLAVLVAAVINFIIPAIWYSKPLFAKPWVRLVGKTEEEMKQKQGSMAISYLIMFLCALLISLVMSNILFHLNVTTFGQGMLLGLWFWIGFVATTAIGDYIFTGRPRTLYLINVGHYLVSFVIMGGVLAVWR